MTAAPRPGILVSLGNILTEANRMTMRENIPADYYFTSTLGESLETIFSRRPKIALIYGADMQTCLNIVKAFRKQSAGMIILAFANLSDAEKEQFRKKMHVFAIMPPDTDSANFISILRKAIAFYDEKRIQLSLREQSELHKGAQAQWLLWKENQGKAARLNFARALIRNILHSASQGLGVGAMLTHVELLQLGAQVLNDKLTIDRNTFDSLVKNSDAAGRWLAGFENILTAFATVYTPEELSGDMIITEVGAAITESERFRKVKNQRIVTERMRLRGAFTGNKTVLRETLCELLLNAFKYSPGDSQIDIRAYATEDFASIMVINDIETMNGGITGIPAEYQTRVFEPFFRLNNTWDDRFNDQRFGLGIGLTAAENAIQQCGGRLYIYEVEVYAPSLEAGKSRRRITAELVLPRIHKP